MSSMRFSARLNTSHHGPPYPFKDAGAVADSLTGIHNSRVKCLFVVNRSCIHKGFRCPPRSNSNFWYVKLVPKVCPHLSVSLCIRMGAKAFSYSPKMLATFILGFCNISVIWPWKFISCQCTARYIIIIIIIIIIIMVLMWITATLRFQKVKLPSVK
jgi:hypothetical protein